MIFLRLLPAILVFAVIGLATPLAAQTLADGLTGFSQNSDEPIDIEADSLEVIDSENMAIFTGNVVVRQADAVLRAGELRVHYEGGEEGSIGPGGGQRLSRLEALGGVEVTSEDQRATGDRGEFDLAGELITLTGNVVLEQGENVVRGEVLTVNLVTRESRLETPSTEAGGGGGRVRGVFVPGAGQ